MHITILGITGGVGHHVAHAALSHGHTVTALVRGSGRVSPQPGLTLVDGDATRSEDLDRALEGADVVFHGLNLPYHRWDPGMIELTEAVIAAAERAGATILFPGNVYGLGPDFDHPLAEVDPRQPRSRKGALRNRLEAMLEAASVPAIVLRAGDFFGAHCEAWMHHLIGSVPTGGAISYPGDRDVLHGWAYLPDLAETFVRLAEHRDELAGFDVFHFRGHVLDGHEFVAAVREVAGDPERRVKGFPWMWLQLARPFSGMINGLFEMRYLWDEPVRMDGSKLEAFLGDVPHTPFAEAVAASLRPADRAAA